MRQTTRWLVGGMIVLGLFGCNSSNEVQAKWRVVEKLPHDPAAYTQGLLYLDGFFYESTGLNGQSSLRQINPKTGEVLQIQRLAPQFFGEGLALADEQLVQLTWKAGVAFVYDKTSFKLKHVFHYDTEGWGLVSDGQRLIMSDGSPYLYFRDPQTFALLGRIKVHDEGRLVRYLNELEYIDGEVWANVYQTNTIVRIDPQTGSVNGKMDFTGLLTSADRHGREDVLNGIAYDKKNQRLFITGKRYGYVYQIEVCPPHC